MRKLICDKAVARQNLAQDIEIGHLWLNGADLRFREVCGILYRLAPPLFPAIPGAAYGFDKQFGRLFCIADDRNIGRKPLHLPRIDIDPDGFQI